MICRIVALGCVVALVGCAASQPGSAAPNAIECVVHGDGHCDITINERVNQESRGGSVSTSVDARVPAR